MASRYPGSIWMPTRGRPGHRAWRKSHPLLVLHTRETPLGRLGGVYPWPPHLTIDLQTGKAHQHVEWNRSAYALKHSAPNRRGGRPTWQVELTGYARDVPHYPHSWYMALADLLVWFHHNLGLPMEFPRPFTGSQGYGPHGGVRVSTQRQWQALSGIVGHAHAPDNRHWDPGHLDTTLLGHLVAAGPHTPNHAPAPEPHHDLTHHPEGVAMLTIALPVLKHRRPNSRGQHERNAQALLIAHGLKLTLDGVFGPAMEKAVKAFQAEKGLPPSGVVDKATWRHLL